MMKQNLTKPEIKKVIVPLIKGLCLCYVTAQDYNVTIVFTWFWDVGWWRCQNSIRSYVITNACISVNAILAPLFLLKRKDVMKCFMRCSKILFDCL